MRILLLFGLIVFGLLISATGTQSSPVPDNGDNDYDPVYPLPLFFCEGWGCPRLNLIKLDFKLKELLFSGGADRRT